jgi:hypothetical protein
MSGNPWVHAGVRDIDHGCFDAGAADADVMARPVRRALAEGNDGVLVHEARPIWLISGPRLFEPSSTVTS